MGDGRPAAAFGTLARGFRRPHRLSPARTAAVALAASPAGFAAAAFVDRDGVEVAVRRPAKPFGRAIRLSRDRRASPPVVAVNGRGNARRLAGPPMS
jgi:hypothetical protein